MKRKLLMFGILFAIMCMSLTGCTIQLDDEDIQTFDKVKDMTNITLNGNAVSISTDEVVNELDYTRYYPVEDYYEEPRVQFSHIDLGNSYYIIVYGHDDFGNTTWTYETEKTLYTENSTTEYLGDYNNQVVYLLDNGRLITLDVDTGDIKWEVSNSFFVSPYHFINDNGNLYLVFGETLTEFMALDINGNVLANIDLTDYESQLASIPSANWMVDFYDDSNITMIGASEAENYREWIVKIDLYDYSVEVNEIKHKELTAKEITEKTLYAEYGESYYFNNDGTFQEYFNRDWIDKYSTLSYSGTWKIENGKLILNTTEEIIAEGGHYEPDYEYGGNILVDYDEKSVPIDMETIFETTYYPDYDGKEMVRLDELLYEVLEPVG